MSKDDDFDGPVFTNCKAERNGGAGFFFGKGARAKLDNCEASDNDGGGFVTEGEHKTPESNSTLESAIKKPLGGESESSPRKNWLIIFWIPLLMVIIAFALMVSYDQYKAQDNKPQEEVKPVKSIKKAP